MRSKERTDIYTRVTNEIVAAIEAGAGSWTMPWHHDGSATSRPINAGTGKAYRGSNILSLWIAAQAAGYSSGRWASYRQWQALGAQVRKGEQATTIVFWKVNDRGEDADDRDSEQEGRGRARMFARGYSVFNEAQVEGYAPPTIDLLSDDARMRNADTFGATLALSAGMAATRRTIFLRKIACKCHPSHSSGSLPLIMARFSMKVCMPQERRLAATVIYPAGSDRTDMQRRRPSQIWEPPWSWPISVSRTIRDRTMRRTSRPGACAQGRCSRDFHAGEQSPGGS
jgi:hypothetical protein